MEISQVHVIKMLKPFYCHYKLCSTLLSEARKILMAPEALKSQKTTKYFDLVCKFYIIG